MSYLIFTATEKYSLNHFIVVKTNNTVSEMTIKQVIDRYFPLVEKHREFFDFDTKKIQLDCDALVYYVRKKNKLYNRNAGIKFNNKAIWNSFNKLLEKLKTENFKN